MIKAKDDQIESLGVSIETLKLEKEKLIEDKGQVEQEVGQYTVTVENF